MIIHFQVKKTTWRSFLVSPVREEFTMKNLLNRSFGVTAKSVREAVIGGLSFSGCLSGQLCKVPTIASMQCIPSLTKPAPGRLGYFIGNYIVRTHSKERGVDGVQVELPMSVRTQQEDKREGMILALAKGIIDFHNLHYNGQGVGDIGMSWL